MTEDTTTQQLAEIEGQPTDYTPPEGWRVLAVGEALREGDVTVRKDGYCYPTERVGGWVGANQRYIRPIEPQPEEQPEPQADTVQVREGRWKTRDGEVRNVTPTPEGDGLAERWPWWDAADRHFWRANGRYYFDGKGPLDLVAYLGPIESEPQPEPQPQPERQATQYTPPEGWRLVETHEELDIPGRDQYVRGPNRYIRPIDPQPQPQPADTADELRSEIHYLQRELAVVKEELTTAAAVSHQLQIELDAAQQVPADSPELQQLRLRLADMTLDRDTCKDAYDRIFADLCTIKETTKAETVEAIVEWLQPFRGCNSPALALLLLEALPHIIRSLTGLADEEIE